MDGSIVRMVLHDFVTYHYVVFEPCHQLNVIIGPNGTGKSSLVCAIALGLGGKPKLLGRAAQMHSFIRAGCTSAKIVIELKNSSGQNYIVTRNITDDSKSTWLLNEQPVTQKQIEEVIMKLNIQVDNLCQFLPQDKVADFSKMNPQELLESTEKCIGPPEMLEYHSQLKELCKKLVKSEHDITGVQQRVQKAEQLNNRIQVTVGNITEKKTLLKLVTKLKQKRAWNIYENERQSIAELKQDRTAAMANLKSMKKRCEPVKEEISATKEKVKELEKKFSKKNSEQSRKQAALKEIQESIEKIEDSIKYNVRERDNRIQTEERRLSEVNTLLQQISKLQNDLKTFDKEPAFMVEAQLEQLRNEVDTKIKQMDLKTSEKARLQAVLESVHQDVEAKQAEVEKIENVANQRLQNLRRQRSDIYEAVMWLRENRNEFQCNILEPMMLEINVTDPANAKYIENVVSNRDLLAFTCESKEDMNKLLQLLREGKNLRINVVHSGPDHASSSSFQPSIPINGLRHFGFHSYVRETITAPEPIMKYLCRMYRIHNIPIGDASTYAKFEEVPLGISTFFSDNYNFRVSVSKYSGERSTRTSEIPSPRYLSITQDSQRLAELQEILLVKRREKSVICGQLLQLQESIHQHAQLIEELREKRKKILNTREHQRVAAARLKTKELQLINLETEKIDPEAEKVKCKRENQVLVKELHEVQSRMTVALKVFHDCIIETEMIHEELEISRHKVITKENESRELVKKCNETEELLRKIEGRFKQVKEELKKLFLEAKELTDGFGPADKEFEKYVSSWEMLPDDEDELNKEIQDTQAKADCIFDDNEKVMQEFENRKTHIVSLQNVIEAKEEERDKLKADIATIKDKWLVPLKEWIAKINDKYGECFAHLGSAGEVVLVTGQNEDDFEQYGVSIRVKYREGEQLQELNQRLQSGGERAVATAVYLISLQGLSRVPFCCVDEINQGMDPVNERMIFELLSANARKSGTAQYFLLTPKLLPSLCFDPTMRVHCVYNGCGALSGEEFDLDEIIQTQLRLNRRKSGK